MRGRTLVALDMGYGHLRPAFALGDYLGLPVLEADRPPLASEREAKLWALVRRSYELNSRITRAPAVGPLARRLLDGFTSIPSLYPFRDLSPRTLPVRLFERLYRRGLGAGLVEHLAQTGSDLVTTFYAPAILADLHGVERIFCVVTDSDINRVWAPVTPSTSNIHYLVPSPRARRRLLAYGVHRERITLTGFPLPAELLGDESLSVLKKNLAARLLRLDPKRRFLGDQREEVESFLGPLPEIEPAPAHLVYAVGGAGAQVELVQEFLPSLGRNLDRGRLRLTVVAGVRQEVHDRVREIVHRLGMAEQLEGGKIDILLAEDFPSYLRRFNALLATADVLWTKPSEMVFFGALGLPLIMSWPLGAHERYNRRWIMESGAGVRQRDPRHAGDWISELLKDGTLASNAWNGFLRLPKSGLFKIAKVLGEGE